MLKISTDIFSASVKKPHNTPLPPSHRDGLGKAVHPLEDKPGNPHK